MPYATNDGCRIHYEVEGMGPAFVLHHWSFASLDFWYDFGYVKRLAEDFRLVLVDSRGHGKSDAPHELNDYRPETRVRDVVAVLDELLIDRAHFFGYSMGGWIGFCMAAFAPHRLLSLIVGGQHPRAQDLGGLRSFLQHGVDRGPEAFVSLWEKNVGPLTDEQRKRMLAYDFAAMIAAAQDRESIEPMLPGIEVPCLLFAGDKDPAHPLARASVPTIPGATFVSLAGLDHGAAIERSDLVAPILRSFAKFESR
jgi:pimeloyl-ACP methyl ester carboxylesterase